MLTAFTGPCNAHTVCSCPSSPFSNGGPAPPVAQAKNPAVTRSLSYTQHLSIQNYSTFKYHQNPLISRYIRC